MSRIACFAVAFVGLTLAACQAPEPAGEAGEANAAALSIAPDVEQRLARYAPTELTADLSGLGAKDREVLGQLVAAGRLMDEIYLRQVWEGGPALRKELATAAAGEAVRTYFDVNFGPWDRLDGREPFIGDMPHPPGAGFYPVGMEASEFEAWVEAHPQDAAKLTSLTTVVGRRAGGLVAIPYSEAYREWLAPAAEHLLSAALATDNPSLRTFLELRAEAFMNDDYYASDFAWMDLDAPIEVTIGPYETYEDGLFGYKSAFEAFVTLNLPEESAALARYKAELPALERGLPIPDEYKNPNRGTESPIRVVDLVFVGGDSKAGVQTLAFNLPNDERVREAKGSKKVLLHNMMRAKYDQILVPIAQRVLAEDQLEQVSFDAYFNEVLHHELAHGLGPGKLVIDGRETEVRLELKELYSTLEEAKADVLGVYDILQLIDRGVMPAELRRTLEASYVAGLFRAARFGIDEAHGQGVVAQFNFLLEKGAVEVTEDGRFRANSEVYPEAIAALVNELLMIQATGDYERAKRFLATYAVATPEIRAAIDRLSDVPVDIRPLFPQAGELVVD
jgi:Peptidase family M49